MPWNTQWTYVHRQTSSLWCSAGDVNASINSLHRHTPLPAREVKLVQNVTKPVAKYVIHSTLEDTSPCPKTAKNTGIIDYCELPTCTSPDSIHRSTTFLVGTLVTLGLVGCGLAL